jgi:hypothetical protein
VFGVVVTLPKAAAVNHNGNRYMVNNWTIEVREDAVSYHPTMKAAKAHLRSVARPDDN